MDIVLEFHGIDNIPFRTPAAAQEASLMNRNQKGDPSLATQIPFFIGSPSDAFTEPLLIWDKFNIYQGHRQNTPFIQIGRRRKSQRIRPPKEANPIKQALAYRELLDSEKADSQGELARLSGIPRSTISAYLRLLNLDGEVQDFALNLDDSDERLSMLTEPRLRPLVGKDRRTQRRGFRRLIKTGGGS